MRFMIKRLIKGTALSMLVMIVPALGNIQILKYPHLWILMVLGVLASVLQPEYNPFTITAKPKDGGTGAQIIWSVYLTQLFAILEAAYLGYPGSVRWDLVSTVALVMAILGLLFRTWSVWTLGVFFTMHIEVQDNQKIIRKGPYRYIRHPSYLGAFVLYISTIVFLHAWYALIVAVLVLPLAFVRRIQYEDKLLRGEFGQDYEEYCRQVKRVLPFIW